MYTQTKFRPPGPSNEKAPTHVTFQSSSLVQLLSSFFILGLSYEQNIKHIGKTYSTLIQPRDSMEPYATPHTT